VSIYASCIGGSFDFATATVELQGGQIWCVQIILADNADQREKCIAACIGEGGAKAMRRRGLAHWTNRPVGRNPFARGMGEDGGEPD
jgi:hypothetical protein